VVGHEGAKANLGIKSSSPVKCDTEEEYGVQSNTVQQRSQRKMTASGTESHRKKGIYERGKKFMMCNRCEIQNGEKGKNLMLG
jgi:hypothetical protein